MVHPLSQAEADRVFTKEERMVSALRLAHQLKNVLQRERRAAKKAVDAMASWWSGIGSPEDLLDYERAAERHQLIVSERSALQSLIRDGIEQ